MEEWKEYRLGELLTIKYGKDHKKLHDGSIPAYGSGGIMRYVNKSIYEHPSILIPRKGSLNNIIYIGTPFWTVDTMFWTIINTELVDPKYLYYAICKFDFAGLNVGSAVPSLTVPVIENIKITLPSLNKQKRIANILSSLDDKIELNRRINENLEQQAQALFKSWFVDFEPFKGGKFVDSELGMIPEEWRVGYYTELVDIKGGGTPKTNIKEYWNGDIPFFSPKDVDSNCFVLDTEKHITAMGLDNCNSNLFPSKTVFITARGTVGKIVMAGTEMAMNQTNYALLGKHNVSQYYVYLITLQLVTRLLKKANGAVFNAITTRDFTNERIVIPFNSIIKSFSSIVEPLYENILLNEFQIKRLSQLRDTLLPRLMSGELQI